MSTPASSALPLRFEIEYQRAEYVSIVLEFLAIDLARRAALNGKPAKPLGWAGLTMTVAILSAAFAWKKRQMPRNAFVVDDAAIERHNAMGVLRVAWGDVVAVHRFRDGYLLNYQRGGMPIPYRCLAGETRTRLDVLITLREQSLAGEDRQPGKPA